VLEPQLNVLPELYSNGVMRMAGFFPSVPMQVHFDLQFKAVEGQWRLLAISVDVSGSGPVAPRVASSPSPTNKPKATPSSGVEVDVTPRPSPEKK